MNYVWSWNVNVLLCSTIDPDSKSIHVESSLIEYVFIRIKFDMATCPCARSLSSLLTLHSVVDVAAMSFVKLFIMVWKL